MLGKNFSRQQFEIFFSYFPRKMALIVHAKYLPGDILHEISKPFYLENKNISSVVCRLSPGL